MVNIKVGMQESVFGSYAAVRLVDHHFLGGELGTNKYLHSRDLRAKDQRLPLY